MTRKSRRKLAEEPSRYVVAWIDILGQKDVLKRIRDSLETPAEEDENRRLLENSAEAVKEFRKRLRMIYKARVDLPPLPEQLPESVRTRIAALRQNRVGLHGVSDAMAVYVPLSNDSAAAVWDIEALLYSCAAMILTGLFLRQPVRGGIDIGIAVEIEQGEIYGSAPARAYELESNDAKYPRILIGDDLMNYLRSLWVRKGTDVETRLTQSIAERCLKLTADDDDGKRILHYLSEGQRDQMFRALGPDTVRDELTRAYRFIDYELDRFRQEGKSKLADRYLRLMAYFNRHIQGWL